MDANLFALAADADPALLERLQAELAAQGSPAIEIRQTVVFESPTAPFMLRSRVYAALEAVCGHDEWQRRFRPLD